MKTVSIGKVFVGNFFWQCKRFTLANLELLCQILFGIEVLYTTDIIFTTSFYMDVASDMVKYFVVTGMPVFQQIALPDKKYTKFQHLHVQIFFVTARFAKETLLV